MSFSLSLSLSIARSLSCYLLILRQYAYLSLSFMWDGCDQGGPCRATILRDGTLQQPKPLCALLPARHDCWTLRFLKEAIANSSDRASHAKGSREGLGHLDDTLREGFSTALSTKASGSSAECATTQRPQPRKRIASPPQPKQPRMHRPGQWEHDPGTPSPAAPRRPAIRTGMHVRDPKLQLLPFPGWRQVSFQASDARGCAHSQPDYNVRDGAPPGPEHIRDRDQHHQKPHLSGRPRWPWPSLPPFLFRRPTSAASSRTATWCRRRRRPMSHQPRAGERPRFGFPGAAAAPSLIHPILLQPPLP